jgi:hypothetical protein
MRRGDFIKGIGGSRSLCTSNHVLNTLSDTDVLRRELVFENYCLLATNRSALVLNVRHPFNVLKSHLPGTGPLSFT